MCFIHVYLQATCEMIKHFASLMFVQNIVNQRCVHVASDGQCP